MQEIHPIAVYPRSVSETKEWLSLQKRKDCVVKLVLSRDAESESFLFYDHPQICFPAVKKRAIKANLWYFWDGKAPAKFDSLNPPKLYRNPVTQTRWFLLYLNKIVMNNESNKQKKKPSISSENFSIMGFANSHCWQSIELKM